MEGFACFRDPVRIPCFSTKDSPADCNFHPLNANPPVVSRKGLTTATASTRYSVLSSIFVVIIFIPSNAFSVSSNRQSFPDVVLSLLVVT